MRKGKKVARIIVRYTAQGKFLTWEGQTVNLTHGTDDDITAVSSNLCRIIGLS
jgi:hypothetical protein